jgi:hypothetical protein
MPKKQSSVVVVKTNNDAKSEPSHEEGDAPPELKDFMSEFIDAIHAKDADRAAQCFMAASQFVDEQPHEEGPHLGDE